MARYIEALRRRSAEALARHPEPDEALEREDYDSVMDPETGVCHWVRRRAGGGGPGNAGARGVDER